MKRKLFGGLLCTTMLCLFISIVAMADVAIDENNFPDDKFRSYVSKYDKDNSGALSTTELTGATTIICYNRNIYDLKGIEYFTELRQLDCYDNNLTSLDISKNTALIELNCQGNNLTSLDISRNLLLKELRCDRNNLSELNVNNNTELNLLALSKNQLTTLDISKNTKLIRLYCTDNSLSTLIISNNPSLSELFCYKNQLTSLIAGNNPNLIYLHCQHNKLAELDISKCNTDLINLVSSRTRTVKTDSIGSYDNWTDPGLQLDVDQHTFVNYGSGSSEAGVKLITVTTDGNGTASASASKGHTFDEVTLTATPNNGYKFKEWETTGGITVTDNKFKIGDQHVGIKAIFEQVPSDAPAELDAEAILDAVAGSLSENADPAGSTFSLLQVKAKKVKKTSIRIGWKAVPNAVGYMVYGAPCGSKYGKLTDVKGTTTFTQINLKRGTYYKYFVAAYDKSGNILATSKTVHIATSGGKKGNTKSVKLNKKKATLKKGKTVKLKATLKNGKLKVSKHRKVAFETDNPKVATVSKSGKVKAIGKGTCYVYAYAQNGVFAKCKITVK